MMEERRYQNFHHQVMAKILSGNIYDKAFSVSDSEPEL